MDKICDVKENPQIIDGDHLKDSWYMTGRLLCDPKTNATVKGPITCGDLNSLVLTGGRIDPSMESKRVRHPHILIDQQERFLAPSNHPFAAQMARSSYYMTDAYVDTRRMGMPIIAPFSHT